MAQNYLSLATNCLAMEYVRTPLTFWFFFVFKARVHSTKIKEANQRAVEKILEIRFVILQLDINLVTILYPSSLI